MHWSMVGLNPSSGAVGHLLCQAASAGISGVASMLNKVTIIDILVLHSCLVSTTPTWVITQRLY